MRFIYGLFAAVLLATSAYADTEYFCRDNQATVVYDLIIKDNAVPSLEGMDAEMTFMKTDDEGVYASYWLSPNFNRVYFMSIKHAPRPEVLFFELLIARGKDIHDMEPLNVVNGLCQIKQ